MNEASEQPIAWSIAGTDPSGGAGLCADIKTFHGLGVYGCPVITALVAQNERRVRRIDPAAPAMLDDQFDSLLESTPPRAVKIGMLGGAAAVRSVIRVLDSISAFTVCDPVLTSSTGSPLLDKAGRKLLLSELLPRLDVVTPNRPEAAALTGQPVNNTAETESAAAQLLHRGAKAVWIKGGHGNGDYSHDFWLDESGGCWISHRRMRGGGGRGTGCTLSTALTAAAAHGYAARDAAVVARAYVHRALRLSTLAGSAGFRLFHGDWPDDSRDLPWIAEVPRPQKEAFPSCGPLPLGVYPLVSDAAALRRLVELGVSTIQLRIKQRDPAVIDREIAAATAIAADAGTRLFVNDYWQEALRHRAYGVHLGQGDMAGVDYDALRRAGLRLGLSTHGYAELARAWALRPSYIAMGTVYPTTSKPPGIPTLGIEGFTRLRRLCPVPVVAIGGLNPRRAAPLVAAGADGAAVISDLRDAANTARQVLRWQELFDETNDVAAGDDTM